MDDSDLPDCSWGKLPYPWRVAFESAWEAYVDGCVPIGAVITDSGGKVLIRERNRIHSPDGPGGAVFDHHLAHAELNAILRFESTNPERKNYSLYSTFEPCPLCMGAFYMSGIRTLYYASRDPYAGSTDIVGKTWYLNVKPVKVYGPSDPVFEIIIMAMAVEFLLADRGQVELNGGVVKRWREKVPSGVSFGDRLFQTGHLRGMKSEPPAAVFEYLVTQVKDKHV